jgi:hypothetical protein
MADLVGDLLVGEAKRREPGGDVRLVAQAVPRLLPGVR